MEVFFMENLNRLLATNIAGSTPAQNSRLSKGLKDVFNAFMVRYAKFDGKYNIPVIPDTVALPPKKLVAYDDLLKENPAKGSGAFVHFYIFDQYFDGPYGIWSGCSPDCYESKKGFRLSRFGGCDGLIAPDFSLYGDMPLAMQIWNVYRSRAFGYWMTTQGYPVIPNVRWTDEESFEFCFDGIPQGSVVAVGTLGCATDTGEKNYFARGFEELIKRIRPRLIIIYGTIFPEIDVLIAEYRLNVLRFDAKRRKKEGD
jgi:hypothetical protein